MNIYDQLNAALETVEPNIVGKRFVKIEIDGNTYSALSSIAGSHQSMGSWGRIDYQMNGKRIAKAKLGALA